MNPGDQSDAIEQYLIAKGEGDNMRKVSTDAYKAALRIATLAIKQQLEQGPDSASTKTNADVAGNQSLSPSEAPSTLPSENQKSNFMKTKLTSVTPTQTAEDLGIKVATAGNVEAATQRGQAKRRDYWMRIEVRKVGGEVARESDPIVWAKSIRCRNGIFQSNDWLPIAQKTASKLGFQIDGQWGRHTRTDWPFIAYTYGSFDRNGHGRSGSSLWRLPCRLSTPNEQLEEYVYSNIPDGKGGLINLRLSPDKKDSNV